MEIVTQAQQLLAALWPFLATCIHVLGASAVTVHVLLRKKETLSSISWIGIAWLSPFLGSAAYLMFGINRIQRKGVSLGLSTSWHHDSELQPNAQDHQRIHQAQVDHANFTGLVSLGTKLTGKSLFIGNAVTPLINGDEAYPEMIRAIDEANVSVALNSYIFDSDRAGEQFLTALKKAHDRGIIVRVLIDGVGARYSKPSMVSRLRAAGVTVAEFLPSRNPAAMVFANLRNHRKILVVDGTTGFTGGTNIREGHCLKLDPDFPVACLHFKIEGPVVAELQEAFAIDWGFTTDEALKGKDWFPKLERKGSVFSRGVPDGPDEDLDKIVEIILGALAVAQKRVTIITPYFLPSDSILDALAVCAMRGVQVDILLPEENNIRIMDWAATPQLSHLIKKGCNIRVSPAPFDHTKLMIVDGIWSLIGSTNWDARSMRLNFEYNLECYDVTLATQLLKIAEAKLERSKEVSLQQLYQRPLLVKLRDGAARLLSPYL
ncbi:phospholipase D-like domain-containing protein [Rubritalea marina]|uniref:phospholipase D-like domain-containing protein n=1 Tax=Rubritalea marina TaxID=361055 RepID=UPI00037DCED1|nr:phospholipase D-like domain-containing protein [Rubritalea marina]